MANPFQRFTVNFRAGDAVFTEGDVGTSMFIVQSGKVRLFRHVEDQPRPLGTLEKGDFFGEMSILEGLPRTQSAEVVEDAELIEINSTVFDKMIRGNIEIAIRMLRKLSIRLRETERQLSELHQNGPRPATAPGLPGAARAATRNAGTGVRLVAVDGGANHSLGDRETLIGRFDPVTGSRPDIDLSDLDLKRSVSRRHAVIRAVEGGWQVAEEVGALNGTWVNETQLIAGQAHPLDDGDELRIGTVALAFHT